MSYYLAGTRLAFALAFTSVLATTPPAVAAKRGGENKKDQERAARKACLMGEYAKGVEILADLFVNFHESVYIFNQGRCFEQNRRYEDAIARFEEYLNLPKADLSAEDRAEAEKRIADCKQKLPPAPTTTAPSTFVPVSRSVAAQATEPAPTQESTAPAVVQTKSPPSNSGSGLRIGGIVVASVGVASLIGGVVLNVKANNMVDDWRTNASYTASANDRQKTYTTLSWIGYGAGAACVATGAILFGVGLKRADSTEVALLPALSPDHAGVLLKGAF